MRGVWPALVSVTLLLPTHGAYALERDSVTTPSTRIYAVRMTDFGVRAPRRFGGLLRVKDRVIVHFDVTPQRTDAVDELRCAFVPHTSAEPTPGATYALCH